MLRTMLAVGLAVSAGCFACMAAEEKTGQPKLEALTLELGDGVTLELVKIPTGTFLMGSPESEGANKTVGPDGEVMEGRFPNETRHEVTISKPFYLGIHQVTQSQYEAVMGTNPSWFEGKEDAARRPVEMVTWDDAMEFCQNLSEKTGRNVRLPTEAEWEYACRAGTTTAFNTGDMIDTDQANYNGNYIYGGGAKGVFRVETTAVGSFPANAWGLYDMHGNVWEWVSDWHDEYPAEAATDPKGPEKGDSRVLRGGSWSYNPRSCRSAVRDWVAPDGGNYDVGFRVALDSDSVFDGKEAQPQQPPPPPPGGNNSPGMPQGNDGIVGIWLGMYATGSISWRSVAFYEDGTYRFSIPRDGFYGFDIAQDKIDNQGKNLWGTYEFDGDTGSWKGDATMEGRESKIKLEADGSLNLGSSYHNFYRCRSVDNYKLDGSYTSISDPSNYYLVSKPGDKPLIRFKPDGTFIDEGLFSTVSVLSIGESEDQLAPGNGTYEIKDFTLILRYSDRRTRQMRFNFPLNASDASGYFLTGNGFALWKMP